MAIPIVIPEEGRLFHASRNNIARAERRPRRQIVAGSGRSSSRPATQGESSAGAALGSLGRQEEVGLRVGRGALQATSRRAGRAGPQLL